jgi:hypothetical protein
VGTTKTKKRAAAKKPTTRKVARPRASKPAPPPIEAPAGQPETVLVLRTAKPDGSSRNGFVWPKAGPVECPDWAPTHECGQGLHGWLWGAGNITSSSDYATEGARWLVVEVAKADVIYLAGKVKFPRGVVVFCGEAKDAAAYIAARAPIGTPIIHGTATAGDSGTATAGDRGTATAGDSGTATAGDRGTATAGYSGTATAGDSGTATAGDRGTATAGYSGTATAGDSGTATAGDSGTATAGYSGTATAGIGGTISIQYWDPKRETYRRAVAEVGEDGIEPGTAYILDTTGERARFVKKPAELK